MLERDRLILSINEIKKLESDLHNALDLIELAEEENDAETLQEAEVELEALAKLSGRLRLESLLSGEADNNDCFLEIHAGAGGTEAQDWAEMLTRMYLRWAESKKYKTELLEESAGEEAGIKSTTFKITGLRAYGWLKTESGVHRLVRISPFDSGGRRHTSFASIWVYPVVDDSIDIEIIEADIRIVDVEE
jgi:peptide chain release factor 2